MNQPVTSSLCNREGCQNPASASLAMKMWPSGQTKLEHNNLVVEIGLLLCNEHVAEVHKQGRGFFLFESQSREVINNMVAARGAPPPDWETVEICAVPVDGSMVIDATSTSRELPQEPQTPS